MAAMFGLGAVLRAGMTAGRGRLLLQCAVAVFGVVLLLQLQAGESANNDADYWAKVMRSGKAEGQVASPTADLSEQQKGEETASGPVPAAEGRSVRCRHGNRCRRRRRSSSTPDLMNGDASGMSGVDAPKGLHGLLKGLGLFRGGEYDGGDSHYGDYGQGGWDYEGDVGSGADWSGLLKKLRGGDDDAIEAMGTELENAATDADDKQRSTVTFYKPKRYTGGMSRGYYPQLPQAPCFYGTPCYQALPQQHYHHHQCPGPRCKDSVVVVPVEINTTKKDDGETGIMSVPDPEPEIKVPEFQPEVDPFPEQKVPLSLAIAIRRSREELLIAFHRGSICNGQRALWQIVRLIAYLKYVFPISFYSETPEGTSVWLTSLVDRCKKLKNSRFEPRRFGFFLALVYWRQLATVTINKRVVLFSQQDEENVSRKCKRMYNAFLDGLVSSPSNIAGPHTDASPQKLALLAEEFAKSKRGDVVPPPAPGPEAKELPPYPPVPPTPSPFPPSPYHPHPPKPEPEYQSPVSDMFFGSTVSFDYYYPPVINSEKMSHVRVFSSDRTDFTDLAHIAVHAVEGWEEHCKGSDFLPLYYGGNNLTPPAGSPYELKFWKLIARWCGILSGHQAEIVPYTPETFAAASPPDSADYEPPSNVEEVTLEQ